MLGTGLTIHYCILLCLACSSVCLLPLHDKNSPECLISNRSLLDKKVRNAQKVPSALSGPPEFSLLSVISLKSPVRNHGSSDAVFKFVIFIQTSCHFFGQVRRKQM